VGAGSRSRPAGPTGFCCAGDRTELVTDFSSRRRTLEGSEERCPKSDPLVTSRPRVAVTAGGSQPSDSVAIFSCD